MAFTSLSRRCQTCMIIISQGGGLCTRNLLHYCSRLERRHIRCRRIQELLKISFHIGSLAAANPNLTSFWCWQNISEFRLSISRRRGGDVVVVCCKKSRWSHHFGSSIWRCIRTCLLCGWFCWCTIYIWSYGYSCRYGFFSVLAAIWIEERK